MMLKKIKNYYKTYEEIINYLFFGFLTTVVSLGSYFVFINVLFQDKNDLSIQFANILSWICAVIFAYFSNRIFVFKSKVNGWNQLKEFLNFVLARISSLVIDMLMMYILYSLLHINDTIAKIIVQFVIVIINYVFSKIIFSKNRYK